MKPKLQATFLTFSIAIAATAAALTGIFYRSGSGSFIYTSIRGHQVPIYGKGLYHHMSAEVAIQGIAQDFVTLFMAVPLLLLSIYKVKSGSLKWHYLYAGTVGYFLVTYTFYLLMGMYNALFLLYVFLSGTSFFLFIQLVTALNGKSNRECFLETTPVRATGGFLVFNAFAIALLWLSIVVPPLLQGMVVPVQVEHYTTLVVQGLDLAILLPAAFIIGIKLLRKKSIGYLWGPVYFVFLSLLMTALTAKVVAMALNGYNVIPVIFIIPVFNIASAISATLLLKNIKNHATPMAQPA